MDGCDVDAQSWIQRQSEDPLEGAGDQDLSEAFQPWMAVDFDRVSPHGWLVKAGSGPHGTHKPHDVARMFPNAVPGIQGDARKLAVLRVRPPGCVREGRLTDESPYYTRFHHACRCLLWPELVEMWDATPMAQRAILCRLRSGPHGYTPLGFIAGKDSFEYHASLVWRYGIRRSPCPQ